MFGPTRGFSGMADSMEPCKMLWGRPLLPWQWNLGWALRSVAYRLVLSICLCLSMLGLHRISAPANLKSGYFSHIRPSPALTVHSGYATTQQVSQYWYSGSNASMDEKYKIRCHSAKSFIIFRFCGGHKFCSGVHFILQPKFLLTFFQLTRHTLSESIESTRNSSLLLLVGCREILAGIMRGFYRATLCVARYLL